MIESMSTYTLFISYSTILQNSNIPHFQHLFFSYYFFMPTVTEFLENHEIYPIQTTLNSHPEILNALIDYVSVLPNPLLCNQQECYVYPIRAVEILSFGTIYRCVVMKRERHNKKNNEIEHYYPYLERLFKNTIDGSQHQSILGYSNRVLIALAKKTPEIYEYFKDNQKYMTQLLMDNVLLTAFSDFWSTFVIQSTMGLYTFLKGIIVRTLMCRILEDENSSNTPAYELFDLIHSQLVNKLKANMVPEDERQELLEISEIFHEESFISLLSLKISNSNSEKTYRVAHFLNSLLIYEPKDLSGLISLQVIEQYFEIYEDSSIFMDLLLRQHLQLLKVLTSLTTTHKLPIPQICNVIKRLLVYSSIHINITILHNMLIECLDSVCKSGFEEAFESIDVVGFMRKNMEGATKKGRYGWKSVVRKTCFLWKEHESSLFGFLTEEDRDFVNKIYEESCQQFEGLTLYKPPIFAIPSEIKQSHSSLEVSSDNSEKQPHKKHPSSQPEQNKSETS